MANERLTADEVEYGGRPQAGIAGKAWSDEARAAALAARKKHGDHAGAARTLAAQHDRRADNVHALARTAASITGGEQHARGLRQAGDFYREAASAYRQAETAHRAGNKGKARQHESVARRYADEADEIHDKYVAKESDKKPKKSFYATGDAVELKARPGERMLVIDAGIDERRGPWVAVRETRAGVPGASQKRVVVTPGELKSWEGK